MEWDENALRVSGDPHAGSVEWRSRHVVRREGDRVLVRPFVENLGVPSAAWANENAGGIWPDRPRWVPLIDWKRGTSGEVVTP